MRSVFVTLVLAAVPIAAQAQEDAHHRALAAGYKSAFVCSGVFNAGRTLEEIAADDLEGIYTQYQDTVRGLPVDIDRERRIVSVAFDDRLPPRIAAWRPGLGCTQLPIGAGADAIATLPKLTVARPTDTDGRRWPDGDAGAAAKTPTALARTVGRVFEGQPYGERTKTTAVVIVKDGRIVAEQYRPGYDLHTPQRTWSVAKSITATVVGRAVEKGLVRVDQPANIPEWRQPGDPRAAITLAQLLHMNSGLWTNGPGSRTDEVYIGGGSVTQWATQMPLEAAPGTRYRYANNDTLLAARSVRAALGDGQAAVDFPYAELFWRIGMTRTTAETDWQGNFVLSSQIWTTARDLARLGLLYMNDGVWNGERLLPEGWSRFVATPGAVQPQGVGYGAFFWLYGPKQGLPEGSYMMDGNRGQYVLIIPSKRVVVVRRGFDPDGIDAFDITRFGRDVLAALE